MIFYLENFLFLDENHCMKKIILFISILIVLNSCQQIIDNYLENQQQENYTNPYKGKYIGTISGNLNGGITFEVVKSGSVTITRTIDGKSETFYASVNHYGAFQEVMGSVDVMKLYGNLETKKGTWKQGSLSGSWIVDKE